MRTVDWVVVLGIAALLALGFSQKAEAFDVPPVIPVKTACDNKEVFREVLLAKTDEEKHRRVMHSVDTGECLLLPMPVPVKTRGLADEFHTDDAIIYVIELEFTDEVKPWFAYVFREVTGA